MLTGYAAGTGIPTTRLRQGDAWTGLAMDIRLRAARAAWPSTRPAAAAITAQDDYAHLLYDGLPADALRLKLHDATGTWVHVSASTGQIVDVQN